MDHEDPSKKDLSELSSEQFWSIKSSDDPFAFSQSASSSDSESSNEAGWQQIQRHNLEEEKLADGSV